MSVESGDRRQPPPPRSSYFVLGHRGVVLPGPGRFFVAMGLACCDVRETVVNWTIRTPPMARRGDAMKGSRPRRRRCRPINAQSFERCAPAPALLCSFSLDRWRATTLSYAFAHFDRPEGRRPAASQRRRMMRRAIETRTRARKEASSSDGGGDSLSLFLSSLDLLAHCLPLSSLSLSTPPPPPLPPPPPPPPTTTHTHTTTHRTHTRQVSPEPCGQKRIPWKPQP